MSMLEEGNEALEEDKQDEIRVRGVILHEVFVLSASHDSRGHRTQPFRVFRCR
jgi:hypothetical protein